MTDSNKTAPWWKRLLELPSRLFQAMFAHNFVLKMFSLALAVLFWVYVMDQVNPEVTRTIYSVPVKLINYQEIAQNNLQLMNEHDYFANVVISGRRNNVLSLTAESITLTADMRQVTNGLNRIAIQSNVASDVASVDLLTPSELTLTFDRIVTIPKNVVITYSDEFPAGLSEAEMTLAPSVIRVTGPESLVNTVASLHGTISASSLEGDVSRDVLVEPLDYDDNVVSGVRLEQGYVLVGVKVNQTKVVPVRAEFVDELEDGYVMTGASLAQTEVAITGLKSIVDGIREVEAEPVTVRGESSYSGLTSLRLPEGVSAEERSLRYDIEIEPIETRSVTVRLTDEHLVGVGAQRTAEYVETDPEVVVTARAIRSVLETFDVSALNLRLNMADFTEAGEYYVTLRREEVDGVEISIQPSSVWVRLSERATD